MKKLLALALIPFVTGCQLVSELVKPNDLTLELQVASTIPTLGRHGDKIQKS